MAEKDTSCGGGSQKDRKDASSEGSHCQEKVEKR